jgi:hypothetical protein
MINNSGLTFFKGLQISAGDGNFSFAWLRRNYVGKMMFLRIFSHLFAAFRAMDIMLDLDGTIMSLHEE